MSFDYTRSDAEFAAEAAAIGRELADRRKPHSDRAIADDLADRELEDTFSERHEGAPPESLRFIDDVQLLELPDPEFLIDGFIQRRGVGVVYAPSGAGKTTFFAGMFTAIATGRPFYGHRVNHPGTCLDVAAEDASGFKARVRSAKRAAGLSLTDSIGLFTLPEPIDLRDAASVGRFCHAARTFPFPRALECIGIDTYAAATPGSSENSSEDTTTAMVHAQLIRDRLQATVIIAHHTNAGGSRERGHTAMRGAADFMISLTPVDDTLHVECSKQRNGAPFDKLVLKMTPDQDGSGCVLRLADEVLPSVSLSTAQAKVLGVLRDTFGFDGATKSEWQRTCHDIAERTFHRVCKVLVESGHVKQVGTHFRVTEKGR